MMNSRSYAYSRLTSYEESSPNRKEASHDSDINGSASTKLRRLQLDHRKERWPGSASHFSSYSPTDPHREYIEHIIKPKETLQGLALNYRCTVFELKLANNLHKETEFFARRALRIPIRQHSSLTEQIACNSESTDLIIPAIGDAEPSNVSPASSLEYLMQKDQDLEKLKEKARVYNMENSGEASNSPVSPTMRQRSRKGRSDCQGDDCGLSWTHILGMALLVLLACPLLYFLYLELNLHKSTTASAHNETHDQQNVSIAL